MNWQWGLGAVIFAVVIFAFVMQIQTAKHRDYVTRHRRRERGFRPDWDRTRGSEPDPKKRRGIRISR